jgi:hypothetical protein
MIGKQILHYKILEKRGTSGRGVDQKSKDLKPDHFTVAKLLSMNQIKFSPRKSLIAFHH